MAWSFIDCLASRSTAWMQEVEQRRTQLPRRLHARGDLPKRKDTDLYFAISLLKLQLFGVLITVWRRRGDNTQRGVTRQKPRWTPRGALLS